MQRTNINDFAYTILTNDPSMTAWGWAVLRKGAIVDSGCIKTESEVKVRRIRKGDDTVRRAQEIARKLIELTKRYEVKYYLSELPHGSQNANAARMIGLVVGLLQGVADSHNIGVEWYSEGDAKKALFEKRSVAKKDTIDRVAALFNWKPSGVKYKDEAVADALAIYHVASQQSPVASIFR